MPLKHFLILFTCLSILFQISCKTTASTKNTKIIPDTLIVKSIKCTNLSEDMSKVSTQEDEVLIKIDLVQRKNDEYIIIKKVIEEVKTFKKRNEVIELNQSVKVNDDTNFLLLSLVELDEKNSKQSVIKKLDSLSTQKVYIEGKYDFLEIDKLFGHDDFLGTCTINLNHGFNSKLISKKIDGMQMFDQYEYIINIQIR